MSGVTFSLADARRIRTVVADYERGPRAPSNVLANSGDNWQWVKISSTSLTSGMYPGHWYEGNAQDGYTQGDVIWIDTPNGETLSTSTYYKAEEVGTHTDGKAIFQTDRIASGGSGITVKDASTTLTSISTINFGGDVYVSGESPTGTANLSSSWTYVANGTSAADARGNVGPSGATTFSGASDNVWVRGGPLWIFTGNNAGCIYFAPSLGYTATNTHKGYVQGAADGLAIGVSTTADSSPGVPAGVVGRASIIYSYPTSRLQTEVDEHHFTGSTGGATTIKVHNGLSLQTGYSGSKNGLTFVSGICTSGSGSSITFGTTTTSGGTTSGVTYSDGSLMQSASNLLIDGSGNPAIKIGSNYASFGEASF